MNHQRRNTLKAGGGLGVLGLLAAAGMIKPEMVNAAWDQAAFEAKNLDAAFTAFGAGKPAESADVVISAPDIAENGAVVTVGVVSNLPGTEQIVIMIEKNPNIVAATFTLPEGTVADVQTRMKMCQTSEVYAMVKADGKFYVAKKEVTVTRGGCSG
ncbi:MAG: thiosulfate oxidation carrier protein SoxY [Opitutaceae bacterium]|nr:thiosulfate oxidation carrier protein SoxY [Opitutaceae bacterium]